MLSRAILIFWIKSIFIYTFSFYILWWIISKPSSLWVTQCWSNCKIISSHQPNGIGSHDMLNLLSSKLTNQRIWIHNHEIIEKSTFTLAAETMLFTLIKRNKAMITLLRVEDEKDSPVMLMSLLQECACSGGGGVDGCRTHDGQADTPHQACQGSDKQYIP